MQQSALVSEFFGSSSSLQTAGGFTLGRWFTSASHDRMEAHGHDEAHFMYVPGNCEYITGARGERARNNANLIFNPAQTFHRDHLITAGRFFSITLSRSLTDSLADLNLPRTPTQLGISRAHEIVNRLVQTCSRWSAGSALQVESLCFELIANAASHPAAFLAPPRWLDDAIAFLHANFARDVTIAEASAAVGIHPVHLARGFRTHQGCSPGEYLRDLRVERAAALLRSSILSLVDIALETGFADQSHFTRQFHRAFGVTPAEYRRQTSRRAPVHVAN